MSRRSIAVFLFILATSIDAAKADEAICQKFSDVCVPMQDMQHGCRCALTTQKLVDSNKNIALKRLLKFAQAAQDPSITADDDDIRFEILPKEAIDVLNRFFSASPSNAPLDQNVFKNIKVDVSVQLMTLAQYNIQQAIDLNSNQLSAPTRDALVNCKKGSCENKQNSHKKAGQSNIRDFVSERAIRFNIGNDTMIAFTRSISSFDLENIHHYWDEKHCKTVWIFWEDCWTEKKHSESVRDFSPELHAEWDTFVDDQMTKSFRTHNNNLLS